MVREPAVAWSRRWHAHCYWNGCPGRMAHRPGGTGDTRLGSMTMKPHIYEVAKGNEVPTQFHGKEVQLSRATTIAECLSSGHYENEEAIVAAAESQWLIGARAAIRTELGRTPKDGEAAPTLESASAKGNAVKLGAPREAKEQKPRTPQAESRKAAADSGNKLFQKMAADENVRNRMFKLLDNEAEFTAWQTAQAKVAAAAQTVADGAAK